MTPWDLNQFPSHLHEFSLTSYCPHRIQTAYVNVDPKKRREFGPMSEEVFGSPDTATGPTSATTGVPTIDQSAPLVGEPISSADLSSPVTLSQLIKSSGGTLRRARIVITVKRTADYKKWLEENPLQDNHAGHDDEHLWMNLKFSLAKLIIAAKTDLSQSPLNSR